MKRLTLISFVLALVFLLEHFRARSSDFAYGTLYRLGLSIPIIELLNWAYVFFNLVWITAVLKAAFGDRNNFKQTAFYNCLVMICIAVNVFYCFIGMSNLFNSLKYIKTDIFFSALDAIGYTSLCVGIVYSKIRS